MKNNIYIHCLTCDEQYKGYVAFGSIDNDFCINCVLQGNHPKNFEGFRILDKDNKAIV